MYEDEKKPMNIVYMGTPDFAVPALEALIMTGHDVCAVVTQPDTARDRGRKISFTPVKEKALKYGIKVFQPEKLKNNRTIINKIKIMEPDFIIVAAYGQLLSKEVLDIPKYGCINIHASLLPRFRGAAPIQRAILAGDTETGVTIMLMEEGLDTGDMLARVKTPIAGKTAAQLHDELAEKGAKLLSETLSDIAEGRLIPEKQDDGLATYAPMIFKQEARIDFAEKPENIERLVRAFNPWPVAHTDCDGRIMKVWAADVVNEKSNVEPGTVISVSDEGIAVAAGGGTLLLKEIQMPGKKRMRVADFLKGNSIKTGTVLK